MLLVRFARTTQRFHIKKNWMERCEGLIPQEETGTRSCQRSLDVMSCRLLPYAGSAPFSESSGHFPVVAERIRPGKSPAVFFICERQSPDKVWTLLMSAKGFKESTVETWPVPDVCM